MCSPVIGQCFNTMTVTSFDIACVASVSVQFGSKELQGDEWGEEKRGKGKGKEGRKEGNACKQTPGF